MPGLSDGEDSLPVPEAKLTHHAHGQTCIPVCFPKYAQVIVFARPVLDEQEHCAAAPLASAPFEGGSLVLAWIREPDKSTFCNLRRDGFMGSVTPNNKMWGLHWNKTREEHAHHGDYQIVSADD